MTSSGKPSNPHDGHFVRQIIWDASFKPQTQQGADIIAEQLNAQVLMPDFFEPAEPWPAAKFPRSNDEEKAEFQAFFGGPAKPQDAVAKLINVGKALKAEGAEFVGTFGFCWGE